MTKKVGLVKRGVAWILDFLFLSIFFFPTTYLYSGRWIMGPQEHLWDISNLICIVFVFIILAYLILMEACAGWMISKKILGIKVVDDTGNKIDISKSLVRNLLRLVDGLPAFNILGIVLIAYSQRGQMFGDRIARTYVVKNT